MLAFLSAFFWAVVVSAADPALPQFAVSAFDLGAVDQVAPQAAGIAAELNAAEWCNAEPQSAGGEWNQVPSGVDSSRWLSVVTVGFGKQADAYVFQFNGPGGAARLAAHLPHRKRYSNGAEQWFPPFERLLRVFHANYVNSEPTSPVPLQLEIVEAPETGAPAPVLSGDAGLDDSLTLPAKKVLPPLRAIITAAACVAGWAPTQRPAAAQARVEVRVLDRACSFRITLNRDGREATYSRERVPWEEYHEQLALLFRLPMLGGKVVDFVRPNPGKVEVLDVEGNRIVCLVDDELAALDPNGQEAWRLRLPQSKAPGAVKKVERYTTRRDAAGKLRLFRWSTALAEIALADGRLVPLAPAAPSVSAAFDVDTRGEAVLAQDGRLSLFAAGKPVWSLTESSPVQCGPRLEPDRVLFGNERGELVAVSRADHRELWRVNGGGRLWGEIAAAGALRLAFSNEDETLVAFAPQDGSVKWRFPAGDVLVQPPFEHQGAVVVVTKQNRIVRLAPESGAVLQETKLPAWIVCVRAMEIGKQNVLAVSDSSGRLQLLGPDLKLVWEVATGARLTGRPVLAQLRTRWKVPAKAAKGSSEEMLENLAAETDGTQPFLLSSDTGGFVYKISTSDLFKR
jgi:outer membrane protein assembly factor BamB